MSIHPKGCTWKEISYLVLKEFLYFQSVAKIGKTLVKLYFI